MYDHYTVTDFLLDQDFQQWVRSPTSESNAHWREVGLLYPHQEDNIEAARKTLLSMKFRTIPEEAIRSEAMLSDILGRIQADEKRSGGMLRQPRLFRSLLMHPGLKIAASILLILGLVVLYYLVWPQDVHIQTAYGETRELELPDGSQVMLNSNSSIRYAAHWNDAVEREVWLEGEAFFKVVKQPSDKRPENLRKFSVHTRGLEIEVLGTEFNVQQRAEKSRVLLKEGKVKVSVKAGQQAEEVYLQPGELLEYSPQAANITHKLVDPESYLQWQDRQLVFNGESLREVATQLREIFGYEVVFSDPRIAEYQFRGIVPFDDPEVLILILKRAYGLNIDKQERTLTFRQE